MVRSLTPTSFLRLTGLAGITRLALVALLAILPGIFTPSALQAADSINTRVNTVETTIGTRLTTTSKMQPALDEASSEFKWLVWALWLVVPLCIYGFMIPFIILQLKKGGDGMDAAKNAGWALGLGTALYFGVLTVFMT